MKLNCPDCGQHIVSEHINIARLVAQCNACDSVFSFEHLLAKKQESTTLTEYEFDTPAGITKTVEGDTLTISRRWFTWGSLPLLGFAFIWDLFLVGWYAMLGSVPGPIDILFAVFPLIHVGVGVGITYTALAKALNRTFIKVDPKRLTVRHYPFKWQGHKELYSSAVEQLYVHEKHPKKTTKNAVGSTFEVHALLKGGGSVAVATGLKSVFQALFIEQEIERHLALEARRVVGEYSPAPHEIIVGRKRREKGSLSLASSQAGDLSLAGGSDLDDADGSLDEPTRGKTILKDS